MKESLTLLQGYYSYFLLSIYTDSLMKKGKIEMPTGEIIHAIGGQSAIKLNTKRISNLLEQISKSPASKNVYGYLSYISSMKGLFGTFMDLHHTSATRRNFLKKLLGNRLDAYLQTIRLCRNLLTHQHTADLRISKYDLESQKQNLLGSDKRIISMTFHYKDIFGKAWEGADTYGFHLSINTATLHTKRTLFDIIDEHTLFLLAESIFNLTEYYIKHHK